eukprot:SAG11_NODE_1349_length_5137_cov_2.880905_1_plen_92_part_00
MEWSFVQCYKATLGKAVKLCVDVVDAKHVVFCITHHHPHGPNILILSTCKLSATSAAIADDSNVDRFIMTWDQIPKKQNSVTRYFRYPCYT